jgi:hypothetical protein
MRRLISLFFGLVGLSLFCYSIYLWYSLGFPFEPREKPGDGRHSILFSIIGLVFFYYGVLEYRISKVKVVEKQPTKKDH